MPIRPIHNDDEHGRALQQVEQLWGAPAGSADAEQLEILATLIDAYEREHHAIAPPDPIAPPPEEHAAYTSSRALLLGLLDAVQPRLNNLTRSASAVFGQPVVQPTNPTGEGRFANHSRGFNRWGAPDGATPTTAGDRRRWERSAARAAAQLGPSLRQRALTRRSRERRCQSSSKST